MAVIEVRLHKVLASNPWTHALLEICIYLYYMFQLYIYTICSCTKILTWLISSCNGVLHSTIISLVQICCRNSQYAVPDICIFSHWSIVREVTLERRLVVIDVQYFDGNLIDEPNILASPFWCSKYAGHIYRSVSLVILLLTYSLLIIFYLHNMNPCMLHTCYHDALCLHSA